MSTIIFEQVPCKKSPAKPNKVLYTFLRTYHFFLIFLEHYGKSGKNIQRKNLPKKEVKSLGTLVINPWSLNLILLLSCDSPTNSDNLNVRAGIVLISWWQGCCFFFCTTTKCRSLSRLPLSPGWADNIRLPFFPMSLACSQCEGESPITPDHTANVATGLWWLWGQEAIDPWTSHHHPSGASSPHPFPSQEIL